jgi:hypothetical protein
MFSVLSTGLYFLRREHLYVPHIASTAPHPPRPSAKPKRLTFQPTSAVVTSCRA